MTGTLLTPRPVPWVIAAAATGSVILRPWRLPGAFWALIGAFALVTLGLLPWSAPLHAAAKGTDVNLLLAGMMLTAELGRLEGLFDCGPAPPFRPSPCRLPPPAP